MRITTERLVVELPPVERASAMLAYYQDNRSHLEPWDPIRPAGFYTLGWWQERLARNREEYAEDRSLRLALVLRESAPAPVVGTVNFSNFVRGAFQACHLGFGIGADHQGQGLMSEALRAAIQHVFTDLDMHRIMANYQPANRRSRNVLQKLGFKVEGHAENYLHIAGAWRDHVLTALTNPAFEGRFL